MNIQVSIVEKMATFAKRVRTRRIELELTQAELAVRSGIKQSDISKIEHSKILQPAGILGLSRALQCSPDWLATGEGEMIPMGIINRVQAGIEPLAHVDTAPPAIKDIADPLSAMAAIYGMLPPDKRRDAVAAATKAMAAFISHHAPTVVNHENPASSQDLPEFSHAATRNKAA